MRAANRALLSMPQTLSETTGPVFGHGLLGELDNNLILNWTKGKAPAVGERILMHGRVLDENGKAVPNTLVEIWQANAGGRYRHVNDGYLAALENAESRTLCLAQYQAQANMTDVMTALALISAGDHPQREHVLR